MHAHADGHRRGKLALANAPRAQTHAVRRRYSGGNLQFEGGEFVKWRTRCDNFALLQFQQALEAEFLDGETAEDGAVDHRAAQACRH